MKFNLLIVCLLLFFGCAVSNNLATKNSEIDELPLEQNNEELVMTNSSEVFVLESKSRSFLIPMDSTEDSIDSLNKILSDLNSQDRIIARGDDKSMEFTFTSNFICKFLNPPAVIKSDDGITLSIEGFDDYEVYTRKEEPSGNWIINIVGDTKKLEIFDLTETEVVKKTEIRENTDSAMANKYSSGLNSVVRVTLYGENEREYRFPNKFICKFSYIPAVIKSDGITLSIEGFDDYEVYTRKEESSGDWLINIIGDSKKLESIYLSDFK